MAFLLRPIGGAGGFRLRVRGEIGPRVAVVRTTTSIAAGGAVAGRGLVGGVSLSGDAFRGSSIVSGGTVGKQGLFAE